MNTTVTAGELDRRIKLQAPTVTRDPVYGSEVTTYTTVATVWAKRTEVAAGLSTQADQRVGTRIVQHLIRYRADVQPTWRIVDGTRRFRLTGPGLEVGRRVGLLLESEETTDA